MRRHLNPRTQSAPNDGNAESGGSDPGPGGHAHTTPGPTREGARRGRHRAERGAHPFTARPGAAHPDSGHSQAAWIGVVVILVGVCVAGAGLAMARPWVFWTGVGIAVLGAVAGKALSVMGLGPTPGYHQEGDVELRDQIFGEGGRPEDPDTGSFEAHGDVPRHG